MAGAHQRNARVVAAAALCFLLIAIALWIARKPTASTSREPIAPSFAQASHLDVALTPHTGEGDVDREIRSLQAKVKAAPQRTELIESLGWAFVAKARLSSDPGFYTLAEQAGLAIRNQNPSEPAAALLLGHVAHAMHRFAEAERIARGLTGQREFAFDYALLGDALMEQGKLGEAVDAYQKMVDLKPSLQAYSRVAHMRWLKGDVQGALHAAQMAARAGSPREREATAWAYTRLATYQWQAAQTESAAASIDAALELAPDYAPALLARGKLLLSEGKATEAAPLLKRAAEINPLPEYLWTAAEALRTAGDEAAANAIEATLVATGAKTDARTFAVFLATRRERAETALHLAEEELGSRQDVFSYDALAWAQLAVGRVDDARENAKRALAEGTKDARLFYHVGAIAAAAGDHAQSLDYLAQARALAHMLLPSERSSVEQQLASLVTQPPQFSVR